MKLLTWTQGRLDEKGLQAKFARRDLEEVAAQSLRNDAATSAPR